MGTKTIWDGDQLPPIGCEVLINLASHNDWVRHVVTNYEIKNTNEKAHHRIFISVGPSGDPRSGNNQRLLYDVKPVDWRPNDEVEVQHDRP